MAILQDPIYPIPGEEVTLSMTDGAGTRVDFELTSVPPQSALALGRLLDNAGAPIDTFTPDVPGEYGVLAYDIRETGVAPPRFRDDPIANPGIRVLGTQTGTVHVAAVMSLPITTAVGHGARLEIRVVNTTVRAAALLEPLTELSRTAALEGAVVTALGNLVGVLVSALGNEFVSGVTDLRAKFELHRGTLGGVHIVADTVTAMLNYPPNSVDYAIAVLNELHDKLVRGHMQAGSSAPRWHAVDDGKNVPLAGRATNLAQGTVLFADLAYRVYERHRVQIASPAAHGGAGDTTNALATAAAPLSALIRDYFDAIAALTPTTAAGESEGADLAAHRYGFAV